MSALMGSLTASAGDAVYNKNESWGISMSTTTTTTVSTVAPAGFTLDESSLSEGYESGLWDGPTFEGNGWRIMSQWTADEGVTFWVDGSGDNAIQGVEAGKIAAALAEISALI